MTRILSRSVSAAIGLLIAVVTAAPAAPGSGTASISPPASVAAGAAGTWTITYTAVDTFVTGTVTVAIPNGWTAPQSTVPTAAGYLTVSTNQPAATPSIGVAGQLVTVSIDTLTAGNTITLVYGDAGAGTSARATAVTTPGTYVFQVASDPTGTSTAAIAASPSLTVVPAAPSVLTTAPSDTTVTAGDYAQYRLFVYDAYGNRSPVGTNRTVGLFAAAGQFFPPGNTSTPIASVVISSGQSTVRFDYRVTATSGSPFGLYALTTDGLQPSLGVVDQVNVTPAALDPSQSTIAATSPVTADGVTQSIVTVTSRDAFGNPRAGDTVALGVTGSAVKTDPVANTNASGQAGGVVTDTQAETVTVSATINGQAVTSTLPTVQFTAGAVSATQSVVDATTPVTADGISTSTVTVTAKDANGNAVSGKSVVLSVTPSASAVLTQPGGVTDAAGHITGTLASTTVGSRTVKAVVDGVAVTDSAVVTFDAGAVASFTWDVGDGSAMAGDIQVVTLTAKDAQGNIVKGYTGAVNLSTTSGDTVVVWTRDSALGALNGSGGTATYTFAAADSGVAALRVTDTLVETITLHAVAGAASGDSGPIVVTHAPADKVLLEAGDGQNAVVNTAVATSPLVRVVDQFGNAVGGQTVTFRLLAGGGSVDVTAGGGVDSTGTTGSDGRIACDVWTLGTLVASNPNRLRALIATGSVPSVDFSATATPGPGANLVLSPTSKGVTVNAYEVVTATLTDQFGNPAPGERVDVAITGTANGTLAADPGHTTTQLSSTARWGNTDSIGQTTVRYLAPGTAGLSDHVDASTSLIPQSSVDDAIYTSTASGGTNLRITFVGPSSKPAGQTFQFTVEAVDGNGNLDPTSTATVDLASSGGGITFSLTDFGATVTQATLASGTATVYGRGTTTGSWDITASASGLGPDTKPVTITDTGTIDHYAVSTVSSAVAGVAFNVTVEARDVYDNLVSGASGTVTLAAIDDINPVPAQSTLSSGQTTLASGRVVQSEVYTKAEPIRVQATDAGSKTGTSNVIDVSAAGAYRIAKVSGDSTGVTAGATQPLTAQVFDAYDNPVAGQSVAFAVQSGGGGVGPTPVATDAGGLATSTLTTGNVVGTNTVKATILDENPPALERVDYTVTTQAGAIASFTVTPAKTSLTAGEVTAVDVKAFDAHGNLVSQDNSTPITLSATGSAQLAATAGVLAAGAFSTTVLDTLVQGFTVSAQKSGGPTGTSATISVSNSVAYKVVKVSGDASGVTVGGAQPLVVEVHDAYGNPVPNATVTFAITSVLEGTLTDTVGDPADGITATNGAGQATATLTTAVTAGTNTVTATILDGDPANLERVTFNVNTVAAGIDHYTVSMSAATVIAGSPLAVTVRAYDASDNLVNDSATQVVLAGNPGNGLVFGVNPVTLSAGVASTLVTADLVQTYKVGASTQGNPSVTGLGDSVVVSPASPAGTITATADYDTITANGTATTTITSDMIHDLYGNQVQAGLQVTVSANNGAIIGNAARTIDTAGKIQFDLRASTTPGTSTVTMTSQTGTASGSIDIVFAPPPTFTCVDPPSPSVVVPGQSIAFHVLVHNTSATRADLTSLTTLSFTDGTHTYSTSLAVPTSVAAGDTATLAFSTATLDANFTAAEYQPIIEMRGADQYFAPIDIPCPLPSKSLLVTSIQITSIVPEYVTVTRGQNTHVTVTVRNNGTQTASVTDVQLNFSPGVGIYTIGTAPELPLSLAAGASGIATIPVTVDPSSPLGTDQIDAMATGMVAGKTVVDNSIAPIPAPSWTIAAGADLEYVAGSLSPMTVSQGASYAFQMAIRNNGGGIVGVDSTQATQTHLTFTDGTHTFSVTPSAPFAIASGATQLVTFNSGTVAPLFATGSYDVSVDVTGTENGAPFTATVSTTGSGDQLSVVSPALVASAAGNSVSPDRVTKGSTAVITAQITNSGGATVALNPATTSISFAGGQFTALLDATGPTTLPPGTTALKFVSTLVSPSIVAASYTPSVHVDGTENGNPFTANVTMGDNVIVDNAPAVAINQIIPSQGSFTADQTKPIKVAMVVQNNGGAAVSFSSASIHFFNTVTEKTSQFVISNPSGFQGGATLNGSAVDTVMFDVSDNVASQMTAANMTIEGTLNVVDVNTSQPITATTAQGGKGALLVQTPAVLTVLAITPSQPTVTQSSNKPMTIRVALQNSGGSDILMSLAGPGAPTLTFTPSGAWSRSPRSLLASGDNTLTGGEIDTLVFDVSQAGNTTGTTVIKASVDGTETNSGRPISYTSPDKGSVLVQSAGTVTVTSVVSSRNSVTSGGSAAWTLTATLHNAGEADVNLALGNAIGVTFGSATVPPVPVKPASLLGGGTLLSGGETDQIVIDVPDAGTYATLGSNTMTVSVSGTELNTGDSKNGSAGTSVTVQKAPSPSYVASSLSPAVVSKGTSVGFKLDVTNPVTNGATLTLDPSTTRLTFANGNFNVGLKPTSPLDIAPGGPVTLEFNAGDIVSAIPNGAQTDVQVELHWTDNGNAGTTTLSIPSTDLTVQDAPALNIVRVRASQPKVTRQQAKPWSITMVVQNTGGAAVDLDLAPGSTRLAMNVLSNGALVTDEYTLTSPTALENAGGVRLASGVTDSLVFAVSGGSGVTTGTIVLSGFIAGTDVNSQQTVSGNTNAGGAGSIVLQTAAALQILSTTPSQATATVNQTGTYKVRVAVRNAGQSDAKMLFSRFATLVGFTPPTGWDYSSPSSLASGDSVLSGGETDTLTFTVKTTGSTAGVDTITAQVAGTETNSGVTRSANTNNGGWGTILLQTPAQLFVDSVTPSRASVTQNTAVPWDVTVALHNAGESALHLTLPSNLGATLADAVSPTVFGLANALQEGGVVLDGGASGTLVLHTNATGTFTSPGAKTVNVTVSGAEINSNRPLVTPAQGSILVQNAPVLTIANVDPDTVTSGSSIGFHLDVTNADPNAATVVLDRGSTRAYFDVYSAFLDLGSPVTIAGGETKQVSFEKKPVDTSILLGQHDFLADLGYTANAVSSAQTETITNGVTIQAPPLLSIMSIDASQLTATAGQTAPWTATMTIRNSGSAKIDLDFASNKTHLTFVNPNNGLPDNTYLVQRPTALANGDTLLAPDSTSTIVFTVLQTGTVTGNIVINGRVEGTDQAQAQIVSDDTFDGGRGSIIVQSASSVAVTAIHTSQPKATAGQTAAWDVRAVLHNAGTATVDIDLVRSRLSFDNTTAGWTIGPATLVGGGNALDGGATDSLLFQVTQTGPAGVHRIDAVVPWTDVNTAHMDSSTTQSSGFGQITVQTAPVLRITTTSVTAPHAPDVDTGQDFTVDVQVQNTGEADARDVVLGMSQTGSSTITPIPPIASVPGGQTVPVSLPVTAAASAQNDTFTTRLTGATDVNSGQTDIATLQAALDSTATAVIQLPAGLAITSVRPSQTSVTQGQSNPWSVIVGVHNTGGADVQLTPPAASNLSFAISGGGTQIDYVVQPPTAFGSGAPGWTLAGGKVDSLVYTIVSTGSTVGTLNIGVSEGGTDRNQPTINLSDAGTTSVAVQPVAGLSILSTIGVGTVNHASASRDTVNTGFGYEIEVTVQNTGGELVDSVLVALSTDGPSQIRPASDVRQSINASSSHVFVFNITAPSSPVALETFTASILPGVKSHNSGATVTPQPPVDNLHTVVTERPANLVTTLGISAPPEATGGVVSPNQTFTLAGEVANTGQAGVADSVGVTLTRPAAFNVVEPLVRRAAAGDSIKWTVTAPATPQASQNFTLTLTGTPNDDNTGATAFVQTASAQVGVTVGTGGALGTPSLAIVQPAGAVDDTVSAGQQFTVRASVTPTSDTQAVVATLTVPGSFSIVGSPVFNMGDGTGTTKTHDYTVIAPSQPTTAADLIITFTGKDKNSGLPVPSAVDTVAVATVTPASLSVSAAVTAPPDATDNTVAVGTPFTVTATVQNAGAAGLASPGTLTMTLPAGYTFASGQTAAKAFTAGAAVQWTVTAPSIPTGPEQIRVDITTVPPDENSGQPAGVTTGTATIAMVTEGAAVAVTDVSNSLKLANAVAPGGATGLDLLGFRIAYNASDSLSLAATIDTIAVTVVGKDGKPLGAGVVAQTLARIRVDLGGSQPYEVANPSTNPVIFSLLSGGSDRTIAPNTFATAVVGVDLKTNPRAGELRVGLRGGGLVVRDPVSNQRLAVTDGQGRPLDGQITSQSLVILSSSFEKYVHNYPNPFRAGSQETRIAYFLDRASTVQIRIFSLSGDLVWEKTIPSSDARAQPGAQEVRWDGRNGNGDVVRDGLYVCVLSAGSKTVKFRIAVAK